MQELNTQEAQAVNGGAGPAVLPVVPIFGLIIGAYLITTSIIKATKGK
ncbi:class IIb bacteriocin, lactobin A/cerein 7B family [Chitinimonas sp. PSY-7]